MQKNFGSILEFTKLKEKCIFCQQPMRACLSNFVRTRNNIPELNVPITSGRFSFEVRRTTESYDIKAQTVIDIKTNALVFTLPPDTDMPYLDQHVAKQAFIDIKPHIELYCANKKCKLRYSLSSFYFNDIDKVAGTSTWAIPPLKLFLENFVTNKHVVQNDWINGTTHIYSLNNEDATPLNVPFMDFGSMDKDKLLNRVQTLVTFS